MNLAAFAALAGLARLAAAGLPSRRGRLIRTRHAPPTTT